MTPATFRVLSGIALAVAIALIARRRRALSASGAVAAAVVGAASAAAGWSWAIILIAFFLTGSWLSLWGESVKRARTEGIVRKGAARDAWQVAANGGVFASAAVASILWPSPLWPVLGAGAIAASTADSWSTEIGTLSPNLPRSITTRRVVPPGTSGGVTWRGTTGGICGALFIGLVTFLSGWAAQAVCAAVIGGIAGSLLDSLLGATLQEVRWCPRCEERTERRIHVCGTETTRAGGINMLDNDMVNAISSLGGAVTGALCLP